MKTYINPTFGDFKCVHCHQHISADSFLSGVQNRNHCPYCLWSRHLDLYQSGDRLAACKSPMKPVGLALKKTKKKYGKSQGEMMIIHLCTECEKVSINRIAADDIVDHVYELFEQSLHIDPETRATIERSGVTLLEADDADVVEARLYGWGNKALPVVADDSFYEFA